MWSLTRRNIEKHNPCGDRYNNFIVQFPDIGLDDSVSFVAIAENKTITIADLVWLLPLCTTKQVMRLLACDFAAHVQPTPVPEISATAILTSRRYAFGLATKTDLSAARTSAHAFAIHTASYTGAAASAAAFHAAAASSAAAFHAAAAAFHADAAAYAAAAYAAYARAAAAEYDWQRELMISVANDPDQYIAAQRAKL